MNCFYCDTKLIWKADRRLDNDDEYRDIYDMVAFLDCPKCGATVETYRRPIHVISKLHVKEEKNAA
tara:strand:- start:15 stop:212 length:198 start_codon:yes stop_codon:yes gene_type:complete